MKQVENDSNGCARFQFAGKVVSIGATVLTNKNSKNYVVGTIEFVDANGEVQKTSAMCYEGNYGHESLKGAGIQPGKEYLCTATITELDGKPSVIVNISHLDARAPQAEVNMFLSGAESSFRTLEVAGEIKS
jgi:hypothetical protein